MPWRKCGAQPCQTSAAHVASFHGEEVPIPPDAPTEVAIGWCAIQKVYGQGTISEGRREKGVVEKIAVEASIGPEQQKSKEEEIAERQAEREAQGKLEGKKRDEMIEVSRLPVIHDHTARVMQFFATTPPTA